MSPQNTNNHVRSVDGKVLVFGILSFSFVILVVCATLVILLNTASSRLSTANARLLEQDQSMFTLRRTLDQVQGRLGVYEDFLIGTQASTIRSIVRRYLLDNNKQSTETTLREFEEWVYSKTYQGVVDPSRGGMGGP